MLQPKKPLKFIRVKLQQRDWSSKDRVDGKKFFFNLLIFLKQKKCVSSLENYLILVQYFMTQGNLSLETVTRS